MKISEKTKKALKEGLKIAGVVGLTTIAAIIGYKKGQKSVSNPSDYVTELEAENQELKVENAMLERAFNKASKLVNALSYHLGKKTVEKELKI